MEISELNFDCSVKVTDVSSTQMFQVPHSLSLLSLSELVLIANLHFDYSGSHVRSGSFRLVFTGR
jgi:hypothetical protein